MTPATWLIAYDIADPKRLRRVERALAAVGARLHNSLFVCLLDDWELAAVQRKLARLIDPAADAVEYTPWCDRDRLACRHLGASAEPARVEAWIV